MDIGQAGIAWYPKLEDGLAEAKRLNKPIMQAKMKMGLVFLDFVF